jgi:tetratricopeptide (TPR) repeat protein
VSHYLALFILITASLFAQSETVSVEELRHPLEGKAQRALLAARSHLDSGRRELGMQELRQALADPVAMPWALSILGTEHLKNGQLDVAIGELQEAVRLLPRFENHSNLAYALLLTGRADLLETGLREARRALQLNPSNAKTRFILGEILLRHGSFDAEALFHLQAAAREIPKAHLVIAQHYDLAGHAPEAAKERSAYGITVNSLLAKSK